MGFEIQGTPMEGRVANLRKVRWNSFQPNFFLLFQEGALNDAPKTFLATISHVAQENRQRLKNKIVNDFPNVSVIDVTRMAGTLLGITARLTLSIRLWPDWPLPPVWSLFFPLPGTRPGKMKLRSTC